MPAPGFLRYSHSLTEGVDVVHRGGAVAHMASRTIARLIARINPVWERRLTHKCFKALAGARVCWFI